MEYKDEQILSIEQYENLAKAYANALKKHGFVFIKVDNEKNEILISKMFDLLYQIKRCLFIMGGFLNTSQIYSLNERQLKKLEILFDHEKQVTSNNLKQDKINCFLNYLGLEFELLKTLIQLKEESNNEYELNKIINDRLSILTNTFKES